MGIKKQRASEDFSVMGTSYTGALVACLHGKEEVEDELEGLEIAC